MYCIIMTLSSGVLITLLLILPSVTTLQFTDATRKCSVIRENAIRLLGSDCFDYRHTTFLGRGKHKKHDLISYIMTTSQVDDPFESGGDASVETFRKTLASFYKARNEPAVPINNWHPVTGLLMEGDIVVYRDQVNLVVKKGKYPHVLENGRKVFKRSDENRFNYIKKNAPRRHCPNMDNMEPEDIPFLINPSSPPPPCDPWGIDMRLAEKLARYNPAFGLILRAQRDRINFFAPDIWENHVVYRYVPGPPPSVWAAWGVWGTCSVPCGTGTQRRTRGCDSGACTGQEEEESQPCTNPACDNGVSVVNTYNGDEAKYAAAVLKAHNDLRKLHNIPPLVYDEEIAAGALAWTVKQAEDRTFNHATGTGLGENMFTASTGVANGIPTPADATYAWYKELWDYSYSNGGGKNMLVGHFSQVIWLATTKVGCGTATFLNTDNNMQKTLIICRYDPPGNFGDSANWNANLPINDAAAQPVVGNLELECFDHGTCTNINWCTNYSWYPKYCSNFCGQCPYPTPAP